MQICWSGASAQRCVGVGAWALGCALARALASGAWTWGARRLMGMVGRHDGESPLIANI